MPTPYAGLQQSAIGLLARAGTAHRAVMEGIATHAQKNHAARQAALDEMHRRQRLATPLKAPVADS